MIEHFPFKIKESTNDKDILTSKQPFSALSMFQIDKSDEIIGKTINYFSETAYNKDKHKLLLSSSSDSTQQYEVTNLNHSSLSNLFNSVLNIKENDTVFVQIEPQLHLTLNCNNVILSTFNKWDNSIKVNGINMKDPIRLLLDQIINNHFKGKRMKSCYYRKANIVSHVNGNDTSITNNDNNGNNGNNEVSSDMLLIKTKPIRYLFPSNTEDYEYILSFKFSGINKSDRVMNKNNEIQFKSVNYLKQLYKSMANRDSYYHDNNTIHIIAGNAFYGNQITDNNTAIYTNKSNTNTVSITFTNYNSVNSFQFNSQLLNQIKVLKLQFLFESIHDHISYNEVIDLINKISLYLSSSINLRLKFNCSFKESPIETNIKINSPYCNLESLSLHDNLCRLSSMANLIDLRGFVSSFPSLIGLTLSVNGFKFNSNYNLRLLLDMIHDYHITHFSMKNSYIEILDNKNHELLTILEYDFNNNIYLRLNDPNNTTSKMIKLDNLKSFQLKNSPLLHINMTDNYPVKENDYSMLKVIFDSESILNKESILITSYSLLRNQGNLINDQLAIECNCTDKLIENLTKDNKSIKFPNSITSLTFNYSDLKAENIKTIRNSSDTVNVLSFNNCNSLFVSNILTTLYHNTQFPNVLKFKCINDTIITLNPQLNPILDQCNYLKISDSFVNCTNRSLNCLSLTFYSIEELADIQGINFSDYIKSIGQVVKQTLKQIKLKGNALSMIYEYIIENPNKPIIIIKNTSLSNIGIDKLKDILEHSSKLILLNVSNIPFYYYLERKVELDYFSLHNTLFKESESFFDYYDMKAKMLSFSQKDAKNKDNYLLMYTKLKENVQNFIKAVNDNDNFIVVYYYRQKEYAAIINLFTELNEEKEAFPIFTNGREEKKSEDIKVDAEIQNNGSMEDVKHIKPTVIENKQKVNWSYFISNKQREFFNNNSIITLKKYIKKNKAQEQIYPII